MRTRDVGGVVLVLVLRRGWDDVLYLYLMTSMTICGHSKCCSIKPSLDFLCHSLCSCPLPFHGGVYRIPLLPLAGPRPPSPVSSSPFSSLPSRQFSSLPHTVTLPGLFPPFAPDIPPRRHLLLAALSFVCRCPPPGDGDTLFFLLFFSLICRLKTFRLLLHGPTIRFMFPRLLLRDG